MGPDPSTAAPASRRQSCDRCHGQKLRCTRPDDRKTGACERCFRNGALCSYSPSLPKGRPSLHRLNEAPARFRGSRKSSSASVSPSETAPPTPTSAAVPSGFPVASMTPGRLEQRRRDTTPVSHAEFNVDHDEDVNMNVSSSSPSLFASVETFQDIWSLWRPELDFGDNMLDVISFPSSNLLPILEAQTLPSSEFSRSVPSSANVDSTEASRGIGRGHSHEHGPGLENELVENELVENRRLSNNGRVIYTADANGFELSIHHLSRLSTRLSQLLGCSRSFLAEVLDPALQLELSIEAVFKSINSWLVHGSPGTNAASSIDLGPASAFDLLHHIFCASNHFIEILHHVRVNDATGCSLIAGSPKPPGSNVGSAHVETTITDGSHHSGLVVHHLVLVCLSLLSSIYVTILIAFQRSADALNSSLRFRASNLVVPQDQMDAALRVHLQLVSMVQLCSYFIKRQNQALDVVVSGSRDSSPSSNAVSDLETEIEHRLKLLQESLLGAGF